MKKTLLLFLAFFVPFFFLHGETVSVTFQVDMQNETVTGDLVYLSGSFVGWAPANAIQMSADGTIYSATVALTVGDTVQYKFVNGASDSWDDYEVISGLNCAYSGDANRVVFVPEQDTVLPTVCFNSCSACPPVTYDSVNVTFQVDMQNESVVNDSVFLAGDFNGWNTTATPMTVNGTVYSATVKVPAASTASYKFINGTTWENGSGDCFGSSNGNRWVDISDSDTTIALVCFNSCSACPPVTYDSVNVTFQVDMQNESVVNDSVFLAGDFNGWNTTATPMTVNGTVYTATVKVPTASTASYKFINGTTWENGSGDCFGSNNGNRWVDISDSDTTLALVCFNSCSACPPVTYDSVNVTFQIDMQKETVVNDSVFLAGDFNGWNTTATPMTVNGTVYTATVKVPTASTASYKFINGTTWENGSGDCFSSSNGNRWVDISDSDTTISLVCFNSCSACPPVTYDSINVTFQVDMQKETVVNDSVFLAGDFNGWNTTATPMTVNGTVYSATVKVPAASTASYKFINGTTWENGSGDCFGSSNGNRWVDISDSDTTIALVCFNSCSACPPVTYDSVNVTFQVDMQNESVVNDSVFLAGDFNGWNTTATPMTANGTVYSATVKVPTASTASYKFINGTTWENGYGDCFGSSNGNRWVDISDSDTTIALVCFNSCSACPPVTYDSVNVTFQVDMQKETVVNDSVFLAGDFNGWNTTATPMTANGTVYSATVKIPTASTASYKFINGTTWENGSGDCFGSSNGNRWVDISDSDTTIALVCFNSCSACPPVTHDSVNVTFQVDMQNESVVNDSVFLAGDFNGWNTTATPMTANGTIYSATVKVPVASTTSYKFINGTTWENGSGDCFSSSNGNRWVDISDNDTTIALVCFNSCSACPPVTYDSVNVTFQLDMQNESVVNDSVFLAGDFNGWNTTATPMTVNGTVYSATVKIPTASTASYKFINGTTWENGSGDCFGSSNGNRWVDISDSDTTIALVCFNSCSACPPVIYDSVNVTFQVDMQNESVTDGLVYLAGSFAGWAPANAVQMTANGTIYTAMLQLPIGATVQYKFVNGASDSWNDYEVLSGLDCAYSDDANRVVFVPEQDTVLSTVCFNSCSACPPVTYDSVNVTFQVDMQKETVVNDSIFLAGDFNGWNTTATPMTANGTVYSATVKVPTASTASYKFINGTTWENGYGDCFSSSNGNRWVDISDSDTTIALVCFNSCSACPPVTYDSVNVTFQVDMQNESVVNDSVFLAGDFNGWNTTATPMTANGTVYSATVKIPAESTASYKFINGTTWENGSGDCFGSSNGNRWVDISDNDTTIALVCFNSCSACPPVTYDSVNVTFQVDMQNESVTDDLVYLAGSFAGWTPANAVQMTANGTIYSAMLQLPVGATVQYKFVNGASDNWSNYEVLSGLDCAYSDDANRVVFVPEQDTVLSTVCFNSCSACPPVTYDSVNVTFLVDMQNESVVNDSVFLTGDFNGWNTTATPMTANGTVYTATVKIPTASAASYKFINGTTWENGSGDCFGSSNGNRWVDISDSDTIIALVCFNSCSACLPVTHDSVNVTFQVDMQNESVTDGLVYVAGSFAGWTPANAVQMTANGTIYTAMLQLPVGATVQYKFVNGASDSWDDYEVLSGLDCAYSDDANRVVFVPEQDTVLPTVCFNSCSACPPVTYDSVNVTFQVDMQNESVVNDSVFLAGDFNGWNTTATPMTANGTVYTATVKVPTASTASYKFINGTTWENGSGDCFGSNNGDRWVDISDNDTTIALVCFNSCSACPPVTSDSVNVTFQVDMQNESVTDGLVYVAGSFAGWTPANAVQMIANGTIYTATLQLPVGATVQYKFVNGASDSWDDYEVLSGLDCAYSDDANRVVFVPEQDTVLSTVCFNSCSACPISFAEYELFEGIKIIPNPTHANFELTGLSKESVYVELFTSGGTLISQTLSKDVESIFIDLSSYDSGVYYVRISDDKHLDLKVLKVVKL